MPKVVSVGTTKVDFVPREHEESISNVKSFDIIPSGSAINFALGYARLNSSCGLFSNISADDFGSYIHSYLLDNNIDLSHVRKIKGTELTTSIYAMDKKITEDVSYTNTNTPEASFKFEDKMRAYLRDTDLIYTTESFLRIKNTRSELFKILKFANDNNVKVAYDPSIKEDLWNDSPEAIIDAHERVIEYVDIFISNTEEIKWISNSISLGEAVKFVYELGPDLIILRHSRRGILIFDGKELTKIPFEDIKNFREFHGKSIFNAAFLYLYLKGANLDDCGAFAQFVLSKKDPESWKFDIKDDEMEKYMSKV